MTGKITIIAPPDKLFNAIPGYLFVSPSTNIKLQVQNILAQCDDDLTVFMYEKEETNIDWLLSAPKFTQTVISANGKFARMVTVDPRAFVIYKNWLSQRVDRDPTKKPRDLVQSKAVALLLEEYMPHFPTNGINHFPKAIRLDL